MPGNRLLDSLPDALGQQLADSLESVELKQGQTIHEPNKPIQHVYFPINCMVSIVTLLPTVPA
jgi:hypothetical protein